MPWLRLLLRTLPLCLLCSCAGTILGPQLNVIEKGVPKVPHDLSSNESKGFDADAPQFSSFKAAYRIAACDDYLIAAGQARDGEPITVLLTQSDPCPVSKEVIYSPLDYLVCPNQEQVKNHSVPKACADPTDKFKPKVASKAPATSSATFQVAAATIATTTLTMIMPNGQTIKQTLTNEPPTSNKPAELTKPGFQYPGSSVQSIHARQLALQGVSLADRYCQDYFEDKGYVQTASTAFTDASSSAASLASSIGGLISGIAALPASVGLVNGLSSSATSIYNKDFLFGSDNISTTYDAVRQAEAADKATALPEPDTSDWTFSQALTVIQQHQDLCHVNNILALLKKQVQSAAPVAIKAVCPNDALRPATRSQTVGAASPAGSTSTDGTACSSAPALSSGSKTPAAAPAAAPAAK